MEKRAVMGISRRLKPLPRSVPFIVVTAFVALVAFILWGRNGPSTDRQALYRGLAQWLHDNALPGETIAVQQASLAKYLAGHRTMLLPADADMPILIAMLDQMRPDYCVAMNSLTWQVVRIQPWFQERYRAVYQIVRPYDVATPLTVFRYTPSPFDAGEIVSTTAVFISATGERLELKGYRLDSSRITPGEPLHLTLYWHAATMIREPLVLSVRLVDAAGERVWWQTENDAPGRLATDLWNVGMQLGDRYIVASPPTLPAGDYVLDVAVRRPNSQPLTASPGEATRFAFAQLNYPPDVSATPLAPDHPLRAIFGEIELLGYDVQTRVAPGQTLRVALYWRASLPVPVNYKVFVHLSGADEQLLAQDDGLPVDWTYPTTQWQPGETIRDEHLVHIPASAARGDYSLHAGLYDAATGKRPPVYDAAGNEIADRRAFLQVIEVR